VVRSCFEIEYQQGFALHAATVVRELENAGPRRVDAAGEVPEKGLLAELLETARLDEAGTGGWRRKSSGERPVVLTRVGRPCGNVD